MAVDFKNTLEEKKEFVWKEIQVYLREFLFEKESIDKRYLPLVDFHYKLCSDYPERKGKYVRPTLLLLTAQAMGFPQEKALKVAAAMQLSEEFALVHDDFEDDSLMRRGKDALHIMYGPELAVNAGDALYTLMWKIIADNKKILGSEKTHELLEEFFKIFNRTILGQTVEIKWTKENNLNLTDEDYFFIIDGKTVYYTIAGPMRLGAITAGATKAQLDLIFEFARPLGRCFQIRDDLLDVTSDFRGLKQTAGDIYEGKRTLMLIHLLNNAQRSDKDKIIKILDKTREEKTEEEVALIIDLMKKYKSIDYAQEIAERFAKQARQVFDKKLSFLKRSLAREELEAGIDFILNRDH